MRRLSLLTALLIVVILSGCQKSTTEATTTKPELTVNEVWEGVKSNYQDANSILVDEYSKLSFKTNGTLLNFELTGKYESTKDPLVHKLNNLLDFDNIDPMDMYMYIVKEGNNYFSYSSLNNSSFEKEPISETEMNEELENVILDFTIDVMPTNITNTNKYTTNGVNYVEYTNVFKLSDVATKYQDMFEVDIILYYGDYDLDLIKGIEIEEKIIVNLDELVIVSANFDVKDIMQKCMDESILPTIATITGLETEHKITFSKYNNVTIDTTILE
ncbi:MAG: hypothetical protein K0Q49_342 [Haloplasmataceae bacterium]|jgi:hypothetical protein|nr:hypothetical protein [Haloplasmataceae bacterium]